MKFASQVTQFAVSGLLLSAALVGAAQAGPVQVKETPPLFAGMSSGSLVLPVQSGAHNYWAGFQTIEVKVGSTVNSFQALCIDPFQWSSTSWSAYNQTTLSPTFSASKISAISKLFNFGYSTAFASNVNSAAMQLALWEVANDDGNLSTGVVHKTNSTNASLVTQTNFLLSHYATASATPHYNFTFYQSNSKQDFVTVTPVTAVPEPETYALLLAGLGIVGAVARRRKSRQA